MKNGMTSKLFRSLSLSFSLLVSHGGNKTEVDWVLRQWQKKCVARPGIKRNWGIVLLMRKVQYATLLAPAATSASTASTHNGTVISTNNPDDNLFWFQKCATNAIVKQKKRTRVALVNSAAVIFPDFIQFPFGIRTPKDASNTIRGTVLSVYGTC